MIFRELKYAIMRPGTYKTRLNSLKLTC